jgi:nitroreductase
MLNDRSSTLSLLLTRRSCRPRDLAAPGPSPDELRQMLSAAIRVPDHGKLHPWRFLHIAKDQRAAFAQLLHRAYAEANPAPGRLEMEAVERFAHQAPELVVAFSGPAPSLKIPRWEQELSCGAACMNLLIAAHAMGYAGGWVTGWAAYSATVLAGLGGQGEERIAGFIYIGSPGIDLEERPRPDPAEVIVEWAPSSG